MSLDDNIKTHIQQFLLSEVDSKVDQMSLVSMGGGNMTAKYIFDDEFCFVFLPDKVAVDHDGQFTVDYDYTEEEIEKLNSINQVLLAKQEQDFKTRFLESFN